MRRMTHSRLRRIVHLLGQRDNTLDSDDRLVCRGRRDIHVTARTDFLVGIQGDDDAYQQLDTVRINDNVRYLLGLEAKREINLYAVSDIGDFCGDGAKCHGANPSNIDPTPLPGNE